MLNKTTVRIIIFFFVFFSISLKSKMMVLNNRLEIYSKTLSFPLKLNMQAKRNALFADLNIHDGVLCLFVTYISWKLLSFCMLPLLSSLFLSLQLFSLRLITLFISYIVRSKPFVPKVLAYMINNTHVSQ